MEIPAAHLRPSSASGTLERLLFVVAGAASLAAIDLGVSSLLATPWWAYHHRSAAWVGLCLAVMAVSAVLSLIPSRAVAAGSAILSGGVLGNVVAARWNGGYVPNPLLVGDRFGGVAFNPADVFTLLGIVTVTVALMVVSIRNADRLPVSTRADRWLQRRLRL